MGDGPIVALRGDIDALAMADEKDVHYRSLVSWRCPRLRPRRAHHGWSSEPASTSRISTTSFPAAFVSYSSQPRNVSPGGALDVIDDDGLVDVDTILGVHCDPKLDVGSIGLRSGAITSAADMAMITLSGPGGHTARPELTVNMVDLAARITIELPDMVRAELGGLGPIKVVFGSSHSGDAPNVIPTHAVLGASVRTPSIDAWNALPRAFRRALDTLIGSSGATYECDYTHGVPPVVNSEETTELVRRAATEELGAARITDAIQSWGGDDFAWFLQQVPGTYVRLGTHDPDGTHDRHDLHVGHFDVDERAIPVGIRLLVAAAYHRLHELA